MTPLTVPPSHPSRVSTRSRRLLAAAVAALLVGSVAVPDAGAQSGSDTPAPDPAATGADGAPVDPLAVSSAMEGARALLPEAVRAVTVVGTSVERVETEILALEQSILSNRVIRDRAIADLTRLEGERPGYRARISAQRERRRVAGQVAEELRIELGGLAVAAYVGAGDPTPAFSLDAETASDAGRQRVLVEAVDSTLRERLAAAEAEIASAATNVEQARVSLDEVIADIVVTTERRDTAIAVLAEAEPALPAAQERYRDRFMTAMVAGADFPVVALDAYRTAANAVSAEQPDCRLPWTVLAGIAKVESRHGTYGGASLRGDGTTSRRIIGIALDGSTGVMSIPDTDGGALDGDSVHDRAVGPMQFIPTTWRLVRRDADGNGRMDPHNLYDAALAAAVYLCRAGPRLDQAAALNRAILTYNRSQPYVNIVLQHRRTYDRLDLPG